jgi:hypothetical protein
MRPVCSSAPATSTTPPAELRDPFDVLDHSITIACVGSPRHPPQEGGPARPGAVRPQARGQRKALHKELANIDMNRRVFGEHGGDANAWPAIHEASARRHRESAERDADHGPASVGLGGADDFGGSDGLAGVPDVHATGSDAAIPQGNMGDNLRAHKSPALVTTV